MTIDVQITTDAWSLILETILVQMSGISFPPPRYRSIAYINVNTLQISLTVARLDAAELLPTFVAVLGVNGLSHREN
jgi:hypothetical protein